MAISSVTSNAPVFQPSTQQNSVRQNFQQLSQAIQSGDLSSAQTAYASLIQNLPQQASTSGSGNSFQQAIASIGSALQSGDISGAQQALQTMQSQMKGTHHHHHHGAANPPADDSNSATTSASASATTALPPTASVGLYA